MAGEDHETVRAEAAEWLREHWDPELSVGQWWKLLAESGWGFPTWPRDSFGRGLPPEQVAAVRSAIVETGAIGPPASLGQMLGGPTLLVHGSAEQRARFLPELATGREFWCQFFSEPGAGSDLAGLQTRAARDGDEWVVNGQKVWTSGAQYADRGMLVARTDPDVPKHQGLTFFIIDLDQPGVEVRPLHQMNDGHGFNEVFFTNARVGHDRIVGQLHGGWPVAVTTLMYERFMSALPSAQPGRKLGMLNRRAGDVASGRVRGEREMAETSIAKPVLDVARELEREADPVIRQRLAQLAAAEEVNRLDGVRSAGAARAEAGDGPGSSRPPAGGRSPQRQSGQRSGASGSVRKVARSNLARLGSAVGMEVLGAHGMLVGPETPGGGRLQRMTLSTPGTSIAGGTDEIQRNIIGERVLGLPKEPRLDTDVPFRDLKTGTQDSAK